MMKKQTLITLFLTTIALSLTGCSGAKEKMGLTRKAPDEFAVVKRAPLEIPPEYALRPPRPGAPRPQETATDEQAREVVFGAKSETALKPANGEAALLQQAGSDIAQPGIREIVNKETDALSPKNEPVAKKLLGLGSSDKGPGPASVVDPKAETERLRQNAAEGKPVTEGETPTVEE